MNPPRGHFSVSRGLESFDYRFGAGEIVAAIRRLGSARPPRILEIGCGEGRALLELRRLFPAAELHGINKHAWEAMQGSVSLPDIAVTHGVFTADDVAGIELPLVHFVDAQHLPFADGSFDVVISQGAIHYVDRKDSLLEEVWRVLAPDGEAFLHIDTRLASMPDFLDLPTPRFVAYRGAARITVREIIENTAQQGFAIRYAETNHEHPSILLRMHRNLSSPLHLDLVFDEVSSFNLDSLNRERNRWDVYWGYRSVFRIA